MQTTLRNLGTAFKNFFKGKSEFPTFHKKGKHDSFTCPQKLSKQIVDENQIICLEDLNIKDMVKNKHLSKSISDTGWGLFKTMIKYKANGFDINLKYRVGRTRF